MNIHSNCPICKNILLISYDELNISSTIEERSCSKRVDHILKFYVDIPNNMIFRIYLRNNKLIIFWNINFDDLKSSNIAIIFGNKRTTIPYFEPDFTNYPKLLDKVKTYITFS